MDILIPELAKYGSVGVIFLLIGVIVFIIRDYHKILSNHLSHLITAYEKNTETMERVIGKNTDTINQLKDVILGCKYNGSR